MMHSLGSAGNLSFYHYIVHRHAICPEKFRSLSASAAAHHTDLRDFSLFMILSLRDTEGGTSDTKTIRLDSRLNMLPKHNATTVHVNIITLYGMLKSGVGRESRRLVVRVVYSPAFMMITAAL